MRRFLTLLLLVTMLASGCTDAGPDSTASGRSAPDAPCDPDVDEGLRAWADAGFSGTVAISTGGTIDCLAGYGPADRASGVANSVKTVFSIGSISKAFTAAAVLRLVDRGELDLDDRAGSILPGLRGPAAEATVRRLLLHTSGLSGSLGEDHVALGRATAVRRAAALRQRFRPGSRYLYSNAGYTLLALIIDRVSSRGYRDYLSSHILRMPGGDVAGGFWDGEPAARGPRARGYLDSGASEQRGDFPGPHWALSGNGDLAMTTRDLARWTRALFRGRIVSPKSTAMLTGPGVSRGKGRSATPGWTALDESVYGEPVIAASGGGGDIGQDAVVAWLPDSDRVVAVASNSPVVRAEDLLTTVAAALVGGKPVPPPEPVGAPVDRDELTRLAGRYRIDEDASLDVEAGSNGIAVTARGDEAVSALFPLPSSVDAGTAHAHGRRVVALLNGEADDGAEERKLVEADFGAITGVVPAGTLVVDGELRTYVTVETAEESVLGWYALDRAGGIAAAELPTDPPTLDLVPVDGGRFRPDDPTGDGPPLSVSFDHGRMALTGAEGTTLARRAS